MKSFKKINLAFKLEAIEVKNLLNPFAIVALSDDVLLLGYSYFMVLQNFSGLLRLLFRTDWWYLLLVLLIKVFVRFL